MKPEEAAFPIPGTDMQSVGMSLRDYFAAKAMPACYAAAVREFEERGWPTNWKIGIAKHAYAMADAMLEARKASTNAEVKPE